MARKRTAPEAPETPVAPEAPDPAESVVPPAFVRVVNVGSDPDYVPLANGALVRLKAKESVDRPLADVTDATRQAESAGRIVIHTL